MNFLPTIGIRLYLNTHIMLTKMASVVLRQFRRESRVLKILTTSKMADNQQSRFEKSLGLLTMRFVTLLQKAKDGVLDLKVVSVSL